MNLKTLGIFVVVITGILVGAGLLLFQFGASKEQPLNEAAGEYVHVIEPETADKAGLITVVEFSDFQCPACRAIQAPLKEMLTKYQDKIRFVYRHFPLVSIHKNAQIAAYAAEAANLQGKFWLMHDKLFETQSVWAESSDPLAEFKKYAQALELDSAKFEQDINKNMVKEVVLADSNYASRARLAGTPIFIVNGVKVEFAKLEAKLSELTQ